MIGFDCIQDSFGGHHAVPRTVWFKIGRFGIRHRMPLLESAEIHHLRPSAIRVDANYTVYGSRQSMRASRTRDKGIEIPVDERNISDPAHETADCRICLAGRELVDYRGHHTMGIYLGDSRGEVTRVWTRTRSLLADSHS